MNLPASAPEFTDAFLVCFITETVSLLEETNHGFQTEADGFHNVGLTLLCFWRVYMWTLAMFCVEMVNFVVKMMNC